MYILKTARLHNVTIELNMSISIILRQHDGNSILIKIIQLKLIKIKIF